MTPLNIHEFWSAKLAGSSVPTTSKLDGWTTCSGPPEGFIEPSLKVIVGDPETARLFLIAAPGAVGKSSYAAALADATQAVVVDLAKTDPLGGNFFTGGLSNAFGYMTLAGAAAGKIALVVDALDEAQMRATPEGYEAGLADIAAITDNAGALPAILLGRAIAAEEAYFLLAESGRDICLLEIQFFDEAQARGYIDGKVQQIGAPTELSSELLFISAEQVLVVRTGADGPSEAQTASLIADEADCGTVQIVNVKEATLSVSWPGAKAHPWTSYAIEVVPAADENVDFMRRRLRKILTAFRSHSKGALRRLAAKIDHIRMTKDARGKALVDHLINDGILVLLPSGKFYELDPTVMARKLSVNYHDLAQSRFSPELDSYLLDVSAKAKT